VGIRYDPAKPKISRGAGGTFETFEAIGEVELDSEIGKFKLKTPALNDYIPLVLLGREDFFGAFRMRFDQRALFMEVERYSEVERLTKRQRKKRSKK
jgi:hypothetical protein